MSLKYSNRMTEAARKQVLGRGDGLFLAYKVYVVSLFGELYSPFNPYEVGGIIAAPGDYYSSRVQPDTSLDEITKTEIDYGFHVFLSEQDARTFAVDFEMDPGKWTVVPVECRVDDMVEAGHYDYSVGAGPTRQFLGAVVLRISITEAAFKNALRLLTPKHPPPPVQVKVMVKGTAREPALLAGSV